MNAIMKQLVQAADGLLLFFFFFFPSQDWQEKLMTE